MEFRDALKNFRREIGLTQNELAVALRICGMTVSRWELGKAYPSRAVSSLLLGYAYMQNADKQTVETLENALGEVARSRVRDESAGGSAAVEHSALVNLINEAPFPIYVCDIESNIMLYANKLALSIMGLVNKDITKYKCHECIMHSDIPCAFCNKKQLSEDKFDHYNVKRTSDGKDFSVYGKLTRWNGHDAQIRCILGMADQNCT